MRSRHWFQKNALNDPAVLPLKEETDFRVILVETDKGLHSPRDAAKQKNLYPWKLHRKQRECYIFIFCSLLFDIRNRKAVSIAPKIFSQPREHSNTVIKMLINFSLWYPVVVILKRQQKIYRGPNIGNQFLEVILRAALLGIVSTKDAKDKQGINPPWLWKASYLSSSSTSQQRIKISSYRMEVNQYF